MRSRSFTAATVLAAAAFAVAGCGDNGDNGSGDTTTKSAQPPTATVKVSETEYRLSPSSPKVAKTGATAFEATNHGKIDHALEVEGPSGERETKPIAPGKSATLRVDLSKPGRYEWYCPIADHKDRGMRGEIVVAGGGSGGEAEDKPKGGDDGGGGGGGGGY